MNTRSQYQTMVAGGHLMPRHMSIDIKHFAIAVPFAFTSGAKT